MESDQDTFHVVIRLPFKRPAGFIEPPAIVWTDEMEHKLWQYMSQKNTDWTVIAEQLGVPTSYVVRHAAFIYETQLRGIHQQLRLNTNTASISSRNSAKSPTPSKPTRPTSIRYSNSLQYQQQYNTIPSNQQDTASQPKPIDNGGCIQPSMVSSQTSKRTMSPSSLQDNNSLYRSSSTTTISRMNQTSQQSTVTAYVNDTSEEEEEDNQHEHSSSSNNSNSSSSDHHFQSRIGQDDEEEEEQEFSGHFTRMKLQVEEPAFLPHRHDSSDSNSMSNSRQQLSISIQNLRKLNSMETPTATSPTITNTNHTSTSNESALNSIGSSFSDLSDSSVTQSALEEAFLSKFNQGSKMSTMLNFSRKYKE